MERLFQRLVPLPSGPETAKSTCPYRTPKIPAKLVVGLTDPGHGVAEAALHVDPRPLGR
jgi:hypothetical protein